MLSVALPNLQLATTHYIYMTHKAHYDCTGTIIIKTRQLKHFHKVKFLRDFKQKAWLNVQKLNDPNDMWLLWRGVLMESIDKHAPQKSKCVGNKTGPHGLLTNCAMKRTKGGFLKKKAPMDGNPHGMNINVP